MSTNCVQDGSEKSSFAKNTKSSSAKILKSSVLIGGSQIITLLLGVIRSKAIALLLGPTGFGLLGLLLSIKTTVSTFADLGIQRSGVREIAHTHSSNDTSSTAKTILTTRRMSWIYGSLAGILLAFSCIPVSRLVFGTEEHAKEIALVAIGVTLQLISGGLKTIIQGQRRISDLARLSIASAVISTVLTIPLYFFLGITGIAIAVVVMAASDLAVTSYYYHKSKVSLPSLKWRDSLLATVAILPLGIAFMWNGLMISGTELFTHSIIASKLGIIEVGIFAAAYRLSGILINMVTAAMGADFYPGLVAVKDDHKQMRHLVFLQTEIGMLLVVPGLLCVVACSPWIILLLYSSEFAEASEILPWLAVGSFLRVLAWPSGFILVAKGHSALLITSQTLLSAAYVGLTYLLLINFDIAGVVAAYLIYQMLYLVTYHIIGHSILGQLVPGAFWLKAFAAVSCIVTIIGISHWSGDLPALIVGGCLTIASGYYCLKDLLNKLGPSHRLTLLIKQTPFLSRLATGLN